MGYQSVQYQNSRDQGVSSRQKLCSAGDNRPRGGCLTRVRIARNGGFTLVEIMVAVAILAVIAVMTSQSLSTAITSSEATQEALKRMSAVDRVWVLFDNDLRNAMPIMPRVPGRQPIPPMYVDPSDEYRLSVLRGGYANPLKLPRTEMVRVGYRFEEGVLWRDTWINIADNDERNAKPQKVLENIEELFIKVLSDADGSNVSAGPWLERWQQATLPAAIEVTLVLKDFGEIKRLYSILPGINNTQLDRDNQGGSQNPNNPGGGQNPGNPNPQTNPSDGGIFGGDEDGN